MALNPIMYNTAVADPFRSGIEGFQIGTAAAKAMGERRLAPLRQQAAQQALAAYMGDPSPNNWLAASAANPQMKDLLEKHSTYTSDAQKQADFSLASQVYSATAAGSPEVAVRILTQQAEAFENSNRPQEAAQFRAMANLAKVNPQAAKAMAGIHLASIGGMDKFSSIYDSARQGERQQATLPAEVRKLEAEANKAQTEAEFAPQEAESKLATAQAQREKWRADEAQGWENLGIERDKVDLMKEDLVAKIEDLRAKREAGPSLSAGSEKVVNDAVAVAVKADALAERASRRASAIAQLGGGGRTTQFLDWARANLTGRQNLERIAAEADLMSEALDRLPPGSASDKDVALLMRGMPSAYGDPKDLQEYFSAMARTQRAIAKVEAAKAAWVSDNGNAGPARRDMVIDGVRIPAGASFIDYVKLIKRQ